MEGAREAQGPVTITPMKKTMTLMTAESTLRSTSMMLHLMLLWPAQMRWMCLAQRPNRTVVVGVEEEDRQAREMMRVRVIMQSMMTALGNQRTWTEQLRLQQLRQTARRHRQSACFRHSVQNFELEEGEGAAAENQPQKKQEQKQKQKQKQHQQLVEPSRYGEEAVGRSEVVLTRAVAAAGR